ncbi:MAG: hypothetical protein LUH15_18585 [Tannerellaceae bacterium]|nr:hypothetical protein [Tannerellaceae bacterium]
MDDLEEISEQALSFNDRKTYAKARYEMALWNQNWGNKKELSLIYLTDAKEKIFCNSTPITSGLYLKITRELAQMYSDTGKHKLAIECYQELYRFIDQIMNHLINDKKHLIIIYTNLHCWMKMRKKS